MDKISQGQNIHSSGVSGEVKIKTLLKEAGLSFVQKRLLKEGWGGRNRTSDCFIEQNSVRVWVEIKNYGGNPTKGYTGGTANSEKYPGYAFEIVHGCYDKIIDAFVVCFSFTYPAVNHPNVNSAVRREMQKVKRLCEQVNSHEQNIKMFACYDFELVELLTNITS